jgi:3',5'-cyclic AMP phosphodiesterase CpdA
MRILHISDLHIGNEKGEIGRFKNIKEWLEAQQWNGDSPHVESWHNTKLRA